MDENQRHPASGTSIVHLAVFDIDIEALDHFFSPTIVEIREGQGSTFRIFGTAFRLTERILDSWQALRKANSALQDIRRDLSDLDVPSVGVEPTLGGF